MKKIRSLALLLFSIFSLLQYTNAQDCSSGTATATLDGNNTFANLNNSGAFLYTGSEGGAFIYPASNIPIVPINSVYAASLWFSGMDPGGNLKVTAPNYGSGAGFASDTWPGPFKMDEGVPTTESCTDWDRMFKVTKESIDAHKADFEDNGVIDGPIPNDILLWPGNGNPNIYDGYGFDIEDYDYTSLAPFHDVNGDARYVPDDGDYPEVQGATTAIWWITNDVGGIDTQSGGDAMRFQVSYLASVYESTDEIINNTTFFSTKITYLGLETLSDTRVSIWVDADLGCFDDDYFGSMPSENLGYVYNADPIDGDENCSCAGVNTYCEAPPIISFKILDGLRDENTQEETGMSSFMIYNNAGIGNPAPGTTDPSIPIEYYYYMSGRWKDGTSLTFGGNGYNPGSTETASFAFPGETNQGDWTMCSEQLSPTDSRILLSSGPVVMEPGNIDEFVFAISGIPNSLGPCDDSLPIIEEASNVVENFWFNEVVNVQEQFISSSAISVFPNPMTESTTFDFGELAGTIDNVSLFSVDGRLVKSFNNVTNKLEIQKDGFKKGMYFYKIRTKSHQLISGKLMVL